MSWWSHLGAEGALLVADETGDVKKSAYTVGTRRQYSGTAGRFETCQVAVYLTYTTSRGHALVDRSLYLPTSWTDDAERRAEAGVPEEVEFTTKPAPAMQSGFQGAAPLRLGLDHHRLRRQRISKSALGCSSAATPAQESWRSTAASPRTRYGWLLWFGLPDDAGPWRSYFSQ